MANATSQTGICGVASFFHFSRYSFCGLLLPAIIRHLNKAPTYRESKSQSPCCTRTIEWLRPAPVAMRWCTDRSPRPPISWWRPAIERKGNKESMQPLIMDQSSSTHLVRRKPTHSPDLIAEIVKSDAFVDVRYHFLAIVGRLHYYLIGVGRRILAVVHDLGGHRKFSSSGPL